MNQEVAKPRLVYLATHNSHKCRELQAMVGQDWQVRLIDDLDPHITWDETGSTFIENARIKAHAVKAHTQACVLGDDSGLMVDALDGAPGVYSSRFSGEHATDASNNHKLLKMLDGLDDVKRKARFVCVLYFIDETGREHSFTGECPGAITQTARGPHGFGYDPLFIPEGLERTMAELTASEKNALSHRRRAVDSWLAAMKR